MSSEPADPSAAGAAPRRGAKAKRIFIGVFVLATLAVGAGAYWFFFMRGLVKTDDARLSGRMVDVSPEVPGQIETLLVDAGDHVTKDQLLFTIDKSTYEANVAKAKAAIATATAAAELARDQLEKALHGPRKAEIGAARATEHGLAAQLDLAKSTLERDQNLYSQNAITKVVLDQARAQYRSADASHEQALERLRLLEQGTRSEDIEAARTAVKVAEAKVEQARAAQDAALVALGHTSVAAPFSGIVVRRWLEPGAAAAPGRAVLTLFDPTTLRIDANIEEKDLHDVAIGDDVDIDIDAYPDLHLEGRVSQILQATNSEFSLIPAEGVSGTFIKVTQRIPLRVKILNPPSRVLLGPGLSVELTIHSGSAPPPSAPAISGT
jgi:multidrug resistance efflux pump